MCYICNFSLNLKCFKSKGPYIKDLAPRVMLLEDTVELLGGEVIGPQKGLWDPSLSISHFLAHDVSFCSDIHSPPLQFGPKQESTDFGLESQKFKLRNLFPL